MSDDNELPPPIRSSQGDNGASSTVPRTSDDVVGEPLIAGDGARSANTIVPDPGVEIDQRPGAGSHERRAQPDRLTDNEPAVTRVVQERVHVESAPSRVDDEERTSVLRVPTFSPLAPLLGWLVAWGAIAVASAVLERIGVHTGLNLGIASGGPGRSGLWAGIWALVVSGGAFVLGGYTAARMARANGTRHAVLVWVVAMAATAADALIETARDGAKGVIRLIIGVPYWSETGLTSEAKAILVLALFAGVSLLGVLIGGGLGQTANRIDRTDDAVVR